MSLVNEGKAKEELIAELNALQKRIEDLEGVISNSNATQRDFAESEEKFRCLCEATEEGIVIHEKGRILEANKKFADMFGYELSELIGNDAGQMLISPETLPLVQQHIEEHYSLPYDAVGKKKDGSTFLILISAKDSHYKGRNVRVAALRDITAERLRSNRLAKINECFLSFTTDAKENINKLIRACGELMEADCALFNRIEDKDMLCTIGQWHVPSGYNPIDRAQGHICYDVILKNSDDVTVVRNLPQTLYFVTDPNVKKFNLKTYIGTAVKFAKEPIGSLCVVYIRDFIPNDDHKMIMSVFASAIATEEERMQAENAMRESEERYQELCENSPISLWEEDFSSVKIRLGELKKEHKIKDMGVYLRRHPETVAELVSLVKVLDVNKETLKLYGAKSKKEFWQGLSKFFTHESYETAVDEFTAIGEGRGVFLCETVNQTLTGARKNIYLKWAVVPGYEATMSKVMLSIVDITDLKKAERMLKDSEEKFKNLAESSPNMIFINLRGRIVYVNQRCVEVMGFKKEEFCSNNFSFFDLVAAKSKKQAKVNVARHMKGEELIPGTYTIVTKEGEELNVIISTRLVNYEGQKAILGIVTDITEYNRACDALNQEKDRIVMYLNLVGSIVVALDKNGKVTMINEPGAKMLGYKVKDVVGKEWAGKFVPKYARKTVKGFLKEILSGKTKKLEYAENAIITEKGQERIISWHNTVLLDKNRNVVGTLSAGNDITDHMKSEHKVDVLNKGLAKTNEKLKQLVVIDPHTGLYNHRYVNDVIEAEFSRAKRYPQMLSVTLIDIDYFKSINDLYGHKFGDLVLKQFAVQLKKSVRQYDVVIRFGGEEFLIISPGTDRGMALSLAERFLNAINLYNFGNKKHSVKLTLSIGVASYPDDKAHTGMGLVNIAERVLNRCKEEGGNRVCSFEDIYEKKPSKAEVEDAQNVEFLKSKLDKLNKQSHQTIIESIFAFAKTIEMKDQYTGEHVEKTVQYASELARRLGLPKDRIELIRQAAMLHDLGKIGISERILLKKAKLTKKEFSEIKRHPQIAADILRPIQFLHGIIPLIFYHHERWDGNGYPSGLKGDEIPIGARIISIADGYEALTSARPYRKRPYTKKEVIRILKSESGTKYDPKVVDVFLNILKKTKE